MTPPPSGSDTFETRHRALLTTLAGLGDAQQRLSWVVEHARTQPAPRPDLRTEDRRVQGCAARLWLAAEFDGGRCRFACDSDSAILKAMATVLCGLYDGLVPSEVATREPDFLRLTGLLGQLTENRRRTILRVRDAIREFAAGHLR